jgi:Fur family zinc uptake transcriptional regulator
MSFEGHACNLVSETDIERFERSAVARLKELGMRITAPRRKVLRALATSRRPLGAYQIRDNVKSEGGKVDVVSVYRILAALVEAGLAHHIGTVDGYLACTGQHSGAHGTEHLICQKCGCVEELPIPKPALAEIGVAASRMGFLSDQTRVEVLGICEHCR